MTLGDDMKRSIVYVLGIFVLIFGVNLMIRSHFGPPPWDVAIVHLADLLGVTLGIAALIIQLSIIAFVMIMRRSWVYGLSVISTVLISIAFDFWDLLVLKNATVEALPCRIAFYLLGVWCLSFGLALVLFTQFKALAVDELMRYFMVIFKTNSILLTRLLVEGLALSLGVIFGWLAYGNLGILSGGTVFITLALPTLLSWQLKMIQRIAIKTTHNRVSVLK